MTLPSRAITILGLVQVMIIIGGHLIARRFVRLVTQGLVGEMRVYTPKPALLLESYGLWLLLLPVSWVCFAALEANHAGRVSSGIS